MPKALPSVPGFSKQQVHDLVNIVHSVMQQYFASSNQITSAPIPIAPQHQPPSTPSAPQEAQKEEDKQLQKQEQQPQYQATVESTTKSTTKSITESTTTHGSSVPDIKSTLSTIPRLCTADSAACLSLNTLLGYTLLGYIKHSKGLEATGQG